VTFEEYVRLRGPALVRLARLLCGDAQLAEDLVQDVLGRAYPRWNKIVRDDPPDAYLRRMLVNANISRWRLRTSREVVGLPTEDHHSTPGAPAPGHEAEQVERDAMWRLIATLPARQRATVVLRYYEDLLDTEIAEILGCSAGTVRTHAMRALATLRERLADVPPMAAAPVADSRRTP
jgi:RNA polymerase sigma-70 factor (sigma-E family)